MSRLRTAKALHIVHLKNIIAPVRDYHFADRPEKEQVQMAKNLALENFERYYHEREGLADMDARQCIRELVKWFARPDPFKGMDAPDPPAQRTLDVLFVDESTEDEA